VVSGEAVTRRTVAPAPHQPERDGNNLPREPYSDGPLAGKRRSANGVAAVLVRFGPADVPAGVSPADHPNHRNREK
jgi:hypothetical protein